MIEEELFTKALELSPSEQAEFLRRECGDDEALRQGVEELLALYQSGPTLVDETCEESQNISLDEISDPSPDDSDLLPLAPENGAQITYFGDYKIEGEIARGAMGIVYRAEQTSLKRTVALKMIRGAVLAGDEDVARFHVEAEAAASLDHPNIVPIYEIGEHEGQQYFSMKLIEGGTLTDRMEELRRDPRAAVKLMATVARAIHAAHQRSILHRDIKPRNILIDEEGEPHVTDFGLAKQLESNSSMTVSGQIMGTPFYMPPEQAQGGARELTTEADIYSLGAVLYHVLTGELPHKGDSLMDTLKLVVEKEPKAPMAVDSSIDRDLETIVLKCLDKDPAKRYPSANELADDLDRWLRGEPIAARPITTPRRAIKWAKRKPVHAIAWGLAAVVLLTLGIGGPLVAIKQARLRKDADEQTSVATNAQAETQLKVEEMRRALYFSEMNFASLTTEDSQGVKLIRDLTKKWIPEKGEVDLRGWEWHYLDGLYRYDLFSFEGHQAKVTAVEFSPDGSRAASLDSLGTLCLWSSADGSELHSWEGAAHVESSLAWNPSGGELALFDPKGNLVRLHIESGEVKMKAPYPSAAYRWFVWSPDGKRFAIARRTDKHLLIVDAKTGELEQSIDTGFDSFGGIFWNPDGTEIAASHYGGSLKIWRVESGLPASNPRILPKRTLRNFSWSMDGKYLAGETNGEPPMSLGVLDAVTLEEVGRFSGHFDWVTATLWSEDSQKVISTSWDRTVRIWNLGDPAPQLVIPCSEHPAGISSNPRGPQIAITEGRRVRIVNENAVTPPSLNLKPLGTYRILDLRWSPDGARVLVAGADGSVHLWSPDADSRGTEFQNPIGTRTWSACWSPDGSRLATATREIVIWNAADRTEVIRFGQRQGNTVSLDWSPDGVRLASLSDDGTVRVWNAESGAELHAVTLKGVGLTFQCDVRWNPDPGTRQLAVANGGHVVILDSKSLSPIRKLESRETSTIIALSWSPDGSRIAVGRKAGPVEIFDSRSGKLIRSLLGHEGGTLGLTWGPEGKRLASAGADRFIRVWDSQSGLLVLTIRASDYAVEHLDWSPDGRRLVSGDMMLNLKIWGGSEKR